MNIKSTLLLTKLQGANSKSNGVFSNFSHLCQRLEYNCECIPNECHIWQFNLWAWALQRPSSSKKVHIERYQIWNPQLGKH